MVVVNEVLEVLRSARGKHGESLLVEGLLMARLDRVIYYILEDLDDQSQIEVTPFDQVAVLVVSLAVADEHPEALHDLGLDDCVGGVPLRLVPNELRNSFE